MLRLSWYCKLSLETQHLYLFSDSAIFVVKKKNWQVGGYSYIRFSLHLRSIFVQTYRILLGKFFFFFFTTKREKERERRAFNEGEILRDKIFHPNLQYAVSRKHYLE